MKEVIKILMRRDGLTLTEAKELMQDCMNDINIALADGCYWEAEDIWLDYTGLEIDYLLTVLM